MDLPGAIGHISGGTGPAAAAPANRPEGTLQGGLPLELFGARKASGRTLALHSWLSVVLGCWGLAVGFPGHLARRTAICW